MSDTQDPKKLIYKRSLGPKWVQSFETTIFKLLFLRQTGRQITESPTFFIRVTTRDKCERMF